MTSNIYYYSLYSTSSYRNLFFFISPAPDLAERLNPKLTDCCIVEYISERSWLNCQKGDSDSMEV